MALSFATPKTETNETTRQERPNAQVWLNVGVTLEIANAETGEVEQVFVALPVGIPLDTMEAMEFRGSNQNWNNMVQAKNAIMEQLQDMAKGIAPGGEETITGLEIQIKRVGKPITPVAGENPLLSAMAGKFTVVK